MENEYWSFWIRGSNKIWNTNNYAIHRGSKRKKIVYCKTAKHDKTDFSAVLRLSSVIFCCCCRVKQYIILWIQYSVHYNYYLFSFYLFPCCRVENVHVPDVAWPACRDRGPRLPGEPRGWQATYPCHTVSPALHAWHVVLRHRDHQHEWVVRFQVEGAELMNTVKPAYYKEPA